MDYAERGGSRPGSSIVGVASVQVVPFNPHRKQLVLCNTSGNDIYLVKGDGPAAMNTGIYLQALMTIIIEPDTLGKIWKGAIQAISSGAGRVISWTEDW